MPRTGSFQISYTFSPIGDSTLLMAVPVEQVITFKNLLGEMGDTYENGLELGYCHELVWVWVYRLVMTMAKVPKPVARTAAVSNIRSEPLFWDA